nr:MAG TPA: hypothetical protein [Caudoviricetes sp.]
MSGEKISRKPPFFADYSLIFLLKYNQQITTHRE